MLSPSLVPFPLALPVSFRPRGIVLQYLRQIVRVLRAPLLCALQTTLPIHRIGCYLPPMVVVPALSLTGRVTTSNLRRLKLGGPKCFLTIAASPFSQEPVLSCHGLRLPDALASNLETHVEGVPRPRQWGAFPATKPARMPLFYSGADSVITSSVAEWIGGAEQPDDITLVLARARTGDQ